MIAALALGGKILNNSDYTNAAINASKFIENNLKDNNNKLLKDIAMENLVYLLILMIMHF